MLLFIITTIALTLGTIAMPVQNLLWRKKSMYKTSSAIFAVGITFITISILIFAFIIPILCFVGVENSRGTREKEYMDKYVMLTKAYEESKEKATFSQDLYDNIKKYNDDVRSGCFNKNNIWINWESYQFWDRLPIIEVKDYE